MGLFFVQPLCHRALVARLFIATKTLKFYETKLRLKFIQGRIIYNIEVLILTSKHFLIVYLTRARD
jgi:hypothetical protein